MRNILVSDIMTRYPVTASPDTNLFECAKRMVRKNVGCLLLVEGKRLVGFISEDDILWALIKKSQNDLSKIFAKDISPKKIAVIKPEATIEEAVKKMKSLKFERLPVIHQGELVGIITVKDILILYPQTYPQLKDLEEIKDQSKKLKRIKKIQKRTAFEGACEECGKIDILSKIDGRLICESCRNKM